MKSARRARNLFISLFLSSFHFLFLSFIALSQLLGHSRHSGVVTLMPFCQSSSALGVWFYICEMSELLSIIFLSVFLIFLSFSLLSLSFNSPWHVSTDFSKSLICYGLSTPLICRCPFVPAEHIWYFYCSARPYSGR